MYTGEASLKSIQTYLMGYWTALSDHHLSNEPGNTGLSFHDWVADKLGYTESTAGWPNMILAYSMGLNPKKVNWNIFLETPVKREQHERSIALFYQLLEEFKLETETTLKG